MLSGRSRTSRRALSARSTGDPAQVGARDRDHGRGRANPLREGDIVSIDVGVGYRGYFTDSAVTVPVGQVDAEAERLLSVTQSALAAGIAAARAGAHIGDIGAAVRD